MFNTDTAPVCQVSLPRARPPAVGKRGEEASMASETHPLQSGWSIWEQREPQAKKAAFSDIIFKLCTFRSVEEFWGYWNNIPKPR